MPIVAQCPSCERKLRVPDHLLDRKVKCPGCGNVFTVAAEDADLPVAPPVEEEEAPPVARRRRRPPPEEEEGIEEEAVARRRRPASAPGDDEEPPEEEEEEERRPRPRRRRSRKKEAARSAVAGPAIALMVVSGLTIVLQIVFVILAAVGVGLMPKGGPGGQQDGGPGFFIGQMCGTLVSVGINGYILTGAAKMRRLTSYDQAKTTAIISLLPCTICWLGLPFGIWALVVLNRYEVREAFR
jgi:predicted Zn finger-like uncharacterized protein